jgi:hypothetical protein
MNKTLAVLLIDFYKKTDWSSTGWVQCREVDGLTNNRQDGMHAKLRFWDLLFSDESHFGFWRVTQKGRLFVEGHIRVPKFCLDLQQGARGL